MVGVERIVPISKVSDLHTALNFYCSVLGFNMDFHYRASPDGPDYVGVSWTNQSSMGSAGSVCSGPGWQYASIR